VLHNSAHNECAKNAEAGAVPWQAWMIAQEQSRVLYSNTATHLIVV